jgi:hypothetical protein
MPLTPLAQLVDKLDTFEVIRDQIAAILLTETASQMALAAAALPPRDPGQWDLRIFTERTNPWGEFVEIDDPAYDPSPIVNVSYNGTSYDERASNVVERQRGTSTYYIDCYAAALSEETDAGHMPGDQRAALEVQRAVRLVRNYLMAGQYTYLGLRGTVARRWPQGIETFEPPADAKSVQRLGIARLTLLVMHDELSPQTVGQPLELLSVNVKRAPSGELSFCEVTLTGDQTP